MGIHDLWAALTPFCKEIPLFELAGKTVAVDLACWVMTAKTVNPASANSHFSNVFFRAKHIVSLGIRPIFILDGTAPKLKTDTIQARNQVPQFYNGDEPVANPPATRDRRQFKAILRHCADMLCAMGLMCLTAKGEAEALCGYLNAKNLVDGVMTEDSDCFAYGARVVYRNLSIVNNACHVYRIDYFEETIRFSRQKIICFALFLGCDYAPGGVKGVGRAQLLDFLLHYKDSEVLDRIRSWRENSQMYADYMVKIKKPHLYPMDQKFRDRMRNEISLRNKALADPNFPNEEIIKEFLIDKDHIENLTVKWNQPDMNSILKFATNRMKWEEIYMFKKFLPLMTLWQLTHYQIVDEKYRQFKLREMKALVFPKNIIKKHVLKGVECYQVLWNDRSNYFRDRLPQEQLIKEGESAWITFEKAALLKAAHPRLVAEFEHSGPPRAKKTKTTAR